jgi:hypothetical protein
MAKSTSPTRVNIKPSEPKSKVEASTGSIKETPQRDGGSALNVIPFVDPAVGVIVFAAASLLKNTVNRIGDLIDDGKPNQSFKA